MAGRQTVENVDVQLTATDKASKVVDGVAKKVDGLEDAELELTADDKASATIAGVEGRIDALEADTALVDVEASGVADVMRDLADIAGAADKVDKADARVDVDIDAAAVKRVKGELDDVRTKGEGLTGGAVNSLADLTGPLGDVSQQVSEFGQAFVGVAELAGPQLERVGIDVGKFAGLLGVGGVALGAVVYFWNTFVGGADAAKDKLAEVQEALAGGDLAGAAKGVTEALKPWRDIMRDVGVSTETATKFITGQTDVLPLNAAAVEDATSKEHFLGAELQRQRKYWADNHEDLAQQQTDQFNATKAIGATTENLGTMTEALLAQARVAVPEVQTQILAYTAMVNGIPQSRFTEITTDANPDDVKQVEDEINNAARDRQSTVDVDADTTKAEAQILAFVAQTRRMVAQVGAIFGGAGPSSSMAPATPAAAVGPGALGAVAATPTASSSGVGLAPAPPGGTVVNNFVTVNVPVGTPTAEVGRYVADALERHERRTGSRKRAVA